MSAFRDSPPSPKRPTGSSPGIAGRRRSSRVCSGATTSASPAYFEARRWFLRSLGGIYLIAFVSLWMQVDGLIGEHGILPVAEYLPAAREHLGGKAPFLLPTLCWLNSSDAFLHFLCGAGAVISVLLMAGFLPVVSLVLLFVLYLSLTIAGQTFLSFQWDILLLETGFLAIFFAPLRWRIRW